MAAKQDLRLEDRAAIRLVVERYCRGVDRLDPDLVNSVYWPEATDDHGIWKGRGPDFAAFVIPLLREHYASTMHTLGQSLIELDGATAHSETYFVAYHRARQNGKDALDTCGGRYVDRLEARDGEWRIADRVVTLEWSYTLPDMGEPRYAIEQFAPARRDRGDVAYRRMMRGTTTTE